MGEPLDAHVFYCRRADEVCLEEAFDYFTPNSTAGAFELL